MRPSIGDDEMNERTGAQGPNSVTNSPNEVNSPVSDQNRGRNTNSLDNMRPTRLQEPARGREIGDDLTGLPRYEDLFPEGFAYQDGRSQQYGFGAPNRRQEDMRGPSLRRGPDSTHSRLHQGHPAYMGIRSPDSRPRDGRLREPHDRVVEDLASDRRHSHLRSRSRSREAPPRGRGPSEYHGQAGLRRLRDNNGRLLGLLDRDQGFRHADGPRGRSPHRPYRPHDGLQRRSHRRSPRSSRSPRRVDNSPRAEFRHRRRRLSSPRLLGPRLPSRAAGPSTPETGSPPEPVIVLEPERARFSPLQLPIRAARPQPGSPSGSDAAGQDQPEEMQDVIYEGLAIEHAVDRPLTPAPLAQLPYGAVDIDRRIYARPYTVYPDRIYRGVTVAFQQTMGNRRDVLNYYRHLDQPPLVRNPIQTIVRQSGQLGFVEMIVNIAGADAYVQSLEIGDVVNLIVAPVYGTEDDDLNEGILLYEQRFFESFTLLERMHSLAVPRAALRARARAALLAGQGHVFILFVRVVRRV